MKKKIILNTDSKPNNIIKTQYDLKQKCLELERELPAFMKDFFVYLNSSVSIRTRLAYTRDLIFFFDYLVNHTDITDAEDKKDLTIEDLQKVKAKDVNWFLGEYCSAYERDMHDKTFVISNKNSSLSRKKSSISVFFKFLFREEMIENNITMGFNPIKIPKKQPDSIKKLELDEVNVLLKTVESGKELTQSEQKYWNKTKLRDRAILYLFITYGLRITELEQLNISSFNFSRLEFTIFRKRDKEITMPFNHTIETILKEYLEQDRLLVENVEEEHKDALFLSLQKKRLGEKAIRNLVKKYTSIPLHTNRKNGYSPHKLRATVASSLIELGFSIYDVQNLLDHEHVSTTQIYATHRKNAKRDIVANNELLPEFKQ